MYIPLKLRSLKARAHAERLLNNVTGSDTNNAHISVTDVLDRLNPEMVVSHQAGVIVTEVGFVTMAIIAKRAVFHRECMIIPGIDDKAQQGHLVLRDGLVPYHSLAQTSLQAAEEARQAHEKAERLVAHFGSRLAVKKAALSAPWYLLSKHYDVSAAGLCQWGAHSFLRRAGLFQIGNSIGLPRILLRLAGSYGNRVTAATLMRKRNAGVSSSDAVQVRQSEL